MEFGLVHILLGLVSFLLFLDGCRSQKKAFPKDQSDKKPNIIFILTDDQDVTMNGIVSIYTRPRPFFFSKVLTMTKAIHPPRNSMFESPYL